MRVRLALVPGEPAGIGPELCVRLAQRPPAAQLLAYADPDTLLAAAQALGLPHRTGADLLRYWAKHDGFVLNG